MSAPRDAIIGERTVRRLGSVRVGAYNIWQRPEHASGPSAHLVIGDATTVIVGAGSRIEVDASQWEVVAVESAPGATGRVVLRRLDATGPPAR